MNMSCILKAVRKTGLTALKIKLSECYHFLFKLYVSKMPDTAYGHDIFYLRPNPQRPTDSKESFKW